MNSRALYVIVEADQGRPQVRAFQSSFGAVSLDRDLFWGAEAAQHFVRQQEPVELAVIEHAIDVRGGAVIDVPNRSLILFGGDVIAEDPALRHVYLELLAIAWQDWDVRWAHEGLADLARSLGVQRSAAVDACMIDEFETPEEPVVDDADWTEAIATVRWGDGASHAYPLAWEAESVLLWGDSLVDALIAAPRHRLVCMQEIPSGGIHLDVGAKRVDFWLAETAPGLPEAIVKRWPGWTCRWHRDEFAKHWAMAGACLRMSPPHDGALLEQVQDLLSAKSGAASIVNLFDLVGDQIHASPEPSSASPAQQELLLERAVAQYRRRRRAEGERGSDQES